MMEVQQIFNVMVEVEKLKSVMRKTRPVGHDRYEYSAEHSWHVSLMALLFKGYADVEVDINRVIKMLLIHDLGEIEVGDTIVYEAESEHIKAKEAQAIQSLFSTLPQAMEIEFNALWLEFDAGKSKDAGFAKAIDRVPPLLHNVHGAGHSWKAHNISKEKVLEFNKKPIQGASQALWSALEAKLEQAVNDGHLV